MAKFVWQDLKREYRSKEEAITTAKKTLKKRAPYHNQSFRFWEDGKWYKAEVQGDHAKISKGFQVRR